MKFKLTVIIRDDVPMAFCGDCPSYRTVEIPLTKEQCGLINLRQTGTSGKQKYYEVISKAILEEDANEASSDT